MTRRPCKILVVEPAPDVLEILVASLSRRFGACITCAADGEHGMQAELTDPHHLVITELELSGISGLDLARQVMSLGARPIILIADQLASEEAIAAMRIGVRDLFRKPFPVAELLDAADRLLREHAETRRRAHRYHRLRELVRNAVRERRDLNHRVELVCKDLVEAHRRLARRVADVGTASKNA